jgi:AcrR family transcriptional regulator
MTRRWLRLAILRTTPNVCPVHRLLGGVMAQSAHPMRADAARNRERVLKAAYETFAAEGLSVPINEVARRSGVGPGTVYRHFPAKDDLVRAVITDRLQRTVDEGHSLLRSGDSGQALFAFMRALLAWGATDKVLTHALAGSDVSSAVEVAERSFLAIVDELLDAAREAGTVRSDVRAADINALIIGCQSTRRCNTKVAEWMLDIVIDGLRASPSTASDGRGLQSWSGRVRESDAAGKVVVGPSQSF